MNTETPRLRAALETATRLIAAFDAPDFQPDLSPDAGELGAHELGALLDAWMTVYLNHDLRYAPNSTKRRLLLRVSDALQHTCPKEGREALEFIELYGTLFRKRIRARLLF